MEVKLPDTIEECHSLIRNLLAVIEKMQAEIDELKARVNENSQNSNRPPSSDGFNKPKPAFTKKKKKRGGQIGHSGKTLKMVNEPDIVINCEPLECEACGSNNVGGEGEIIERRQVFDLPEPKLEITEYRRVKRQCECGQTMIGRFPESVLAPVQYGVKVQAMVALLSVQGCLAHRKIGQLFADLYGYELNEATTQALVRRTAEKMPMAQIRAAIVKSKVIKVDETGMREGSILNWLHNTSTEELTYQYAHPKRGTAAMTSEESVLPEYQGISVHDCWGSYFRFSEMKHAICNAHILRELTGLIENTNSNWAEEMKELLMQMYIASEYGKGVIKEELESYEKRYFEIISQGQEEEPPPKKLHSKGKLKRTKGRNLLERMSQYAEAVLMFAKVEEVPFTNNQAERDLRAAKVKQKVSGGFRSTQGLQSYARINSFISTMRKMKRGIFQELRSIIEGRPFVLYPS